MNLRRHLQIFYIGSFVSTALADTVELTDVLRSVRTQYPPLLASYMQQDIASGRVRTAQGAFDPVFTASVMVRPVNFYEATNTEFLYEQPLVNWGGKIYGGHRFTSGFLPSYERKIRTADAGELVLGIDIPLLRGRDFDEKRAKLSKAQLTQELARPQILNQYLTFHREARVQYYKWVGSGMKLGVAEQVLEIAEKRGEFFKEQIKEGAIAEISQIDNDRLIVSRNISVLKAKRDFEKASIALSLLYRDANGQPIVPNRSDLPRSFPETIKFHELTVINDRNAAAFRRPEIRQYDIIIALARVDARLARNNTKADLRFKLELNQQLGGERPKDIDETEITGLLKYAMPIGQNEARGRINEIESKIVKLQTDLRFAREKIIADVNDSYSALYAVSQTLRQTRRNVELAQRLEEAEREKFRAGASDLLLVQLREQATYQARIQEIEALLSYYIASADYLAAAARDTPTALLARR